MIICGDGGIQEVRRLPHKTWLARRIEPAFWVGGRGETSSRVVGSLITGMFSQRESRGGEGKPGVWTGAPAGLGPSLCQG